ncbi:MFS transporter [Egicoccus halophilus]|uniref:MFS transporter n=1 Tax=Egicoccus halophilus TaxID=1670830 RepID=A0A8J3A5K7_9ACTN|nr:MFS transporter [Egicoccus halophilus]GGI03148.1 MFS transporter [Egicoccus halophilus]
MRAYRDLLAHPEARWPLITSTVSRLTPGMIALALVLLLRGSGYGFAAAGLVTSAHQVGVGVGAPVQGRLADRVGQSRLLVPDAVLYAAGTFALAILAGRGSGVGLLVGIAVVTGLFFPPVTACSRVLLSRLFPTGRGRETAFAVSSIAVELGFVLGPLVAAALDVRYGGGVAVAAAGGIAMVGALGYAATGAARRVPPRDPGVAVGGALRSPGVRVMVLAFACMAVVFGVIDIVVPAVAELAGSPQSAGGLLAALAGGSLLGGLVYGARSWPGSLPQRLRVLVVVLAVGLALLPTALGSLPGFAVALFLGGLFLAPTTICAFQLIDDLAMPGTQTEAQSWTQSGVVFGVAAGAALSGLAVDVRGPALALLGGAACVGLGAVIINARAARLHPPLPAPVEGAGR